MSKQNDLMEIAKFTEGTVSEMTPGMDMSINIDPVALVNGILDCYKQVTVAKEEQKTLRKKIREQSRVYIAAIEAKTERFEMALDLAKGERMNLVTTICNLVQQDGVDEYSLELCKWILKYLSETNPMNQIGEAQGFEESIIKRIG